MTRLVDVVLYLGGHVAGHAKMEWPSDHRGNPVDLESGVEAMVFVTGPKKSPVLMARAELSELVSAKKPKDKS